MDHYIFEEASLQIRLAFSKRICNCEKTPIYGYKDDGVPLYCDYCKPDKPSKPLIRYCLCGNIARYGYPKVRIKLYCSNCVTGLNIVTNIRYINGDTCVCGKPAKFGPLEGKKLTCGDCKLEGYVNLDALRCKCGKRAVCHDINNKRIRYCKECIEGEVVGYTGYCKCGSKAKFTGNANSSKTKNKPTLCSKCVRLSPAHLHSNNIG